MGRAPRLNLAGDIHHVYARGNAGDSIFRVEADWHHYLRLLGRASKRCDVKWLAYCLMPNHVHLLVETPAADLSSAMHAVQSTYAREFNARHGRYGHVFQGRFGNTAVRSDDQLLTAVRYLAHNPVEASLCDEPCDWPWSSVLASLSGDPPPWLAHDRLLNLISDEDLRARDVYAALVCAEATAAAAENGELLTVPDTA